MELVVTFKVQNGLPCHARPIYLMNIGSLLLYSSGLPKVFSKWMNAVQSTSANFSSNFKGQKTFDFNQRYEKCLISAAFFVSKHILISILFAMTYLRPLPSHSGLEIGTRRTLALFCWIWAKICIKAERTLFYIH